MIRYTRRIAKVSAVRHSGKGSFYDLYVILGKEKFADDTVTLNLEYRGSEVVVKEYTSSRKSYKIDTVSETSYKDMKEAKKYTEIRVAELLASGLIQLS